jgi:hypothetical protein
VDLGADPFLYKKDIEDIYLDEDYYFYGSAFHTSLASTNPEIFEYFKSLKNNINDDINFIFEIQTSYFYKKVEYDEALLISNAAFFLSQNNNANFLKQFAHYQIDFNAQEGINNYTPMFEAISANNVVGVQFFLDMGWDQAYSKRALKWASEKDLDPEIKLMLETDLDN